MLVVAAAVLAVGAAAGSAGADEPGSADVIAGSEVSAESFGARWPFMVGLAIGLDGGGYALCGGSLIDDRTVMTAAHCVVDGASIAAANTITAYLGSREYGQGTQLAVEQVFVHPGYDGTKADADITRYERDIALLHLSSSAAAQPIEIIGETESALWGAGGGMAIGTDGPWAAGWGYTQEGVAASAPDFLHEVAVPIIANETCSGTSPPGYGAGLQTAFRICAGDPAQQGGTGADTCQGDSGGPLIVQDGAGGYRVVGITSSGYGCGSSSYGLYTHVGAYRSWITAYRFGGAGAAGAIQDLSVSQHLTSLAATWATPETMPDNIEVRLEGPGPDRVATLAGSATGRTFTGLNPDTTYTISVVGWHGGDTTPPTRWTGSTLRDIVTPGRPGAPVVTRRTTSSISMTWSAATDNHRVSTYRLYRRVSTGWRLIGSPSSRAFTIRNLRRGTRYLVAVRAVDPTGNMGALSPARYVSTA